MSEQTVQMIRVGSCVGAASAMRAKMREIVGEWFAMSREDAGWIMAKAGSVGHSRMMRTGSPCISCPFDGGMQCGAIAEKIMLARRREAKTWFRPRHWPREREAANRRRLRAGGAA